MTSTSYLKNIWTKIRLSNFYYGVSLTLCVPHDVYIRHDPEIDPPTNIVKMRHFDMLKIQNRHENRNLR